MKPQSEEHIFNSREVARIAGITPRQIQWWDEGRVISPKHVACKRLYELEDMINICVIAELRRKGFPLQKIRRGLRYVEREIRRRLDDSSELYLLMDRECHVLFVSTPQQVVKVMQDSKSGMVLVSISDLFSVLRQPGVLARRD